MKHIRLKLSGLLFMLLMLNACSDRLELEPEQSLSESAAFATEASSFASLMGVYSQAQLIEVFGSQPQIIQDYMADNTEFVGSFPTLQEIKDFVQVTTNVSISSWWQVHYRNINGANAVIDRVPTVDDPAMTEAVAAQYIAEAKFMRALLYFNLVNLFGQPYNFDNGASLGVPLVLESFTGEVDLPARATVAEVHAQIRQDLLDALEGLEANVGPGRATKNAARAYLARLHLYRGEYQEAADFAGQVLDAGVSLAPDLSFWASQGSSQEDIFTIVNSTVDNGRTGAGGWASYHRPASLGGRGDCPFAESLLDAFAEEPGDLRFDELHDLVTDAAGRADVPMTRKFPDGVNNADNSPMMRVAEVILTRAEALAELNGVNQESVDLANQVRARAGLDEWTTGDFSSGTELVEAILNERRKELCFEGHRRMDLLRKGRGLRDFGPNQADAAFGAPRTIMPIPQREIDQNPNLVQNSGY